MMRFAKIGLNNKVIDIVVVSTSNTTNANNDFDENIGKEYLEKITTWPLWVACTDNRGSAGRGVTWNEEHNIFIEEQPFPSWNINYSTGKYEPPIDYPSDYDTVKYQWNEGTQSWDAI